LLKVEHVTKKYGKTIANDDISFSIDGGQIAILLGPNGAGKSTIIKCIAGLLRISGTIEVDGHPNKSLEAKRALGYIPEMPAIYDLLTVEEHLEFIRRAYRLEDDGYGRSLLERLSCGTKKTSWARSCPRGCCKSCPSAAPLCINRGWSFLTSPWWGLTPTPSRSSNSCFAR
jgi:ABC-type multidrug transport system ATPase subunit